MKAILRWSLRTVVAAGIVVVLLVGGYFAWTTWRIQSSAPQIAGEAEAPGLSGDAVIVRDEYGVPHIFGETESEVYFAMGFAHAQDRFFQMDLIRRSVHGRLAELFGSAATRFDARARLRGDAAVARTGAERLVGPGRAAVEAYVAGVNAALDSDTFATPAEYGILFAKPEPWTVADTAAVWVSMANTLSGSGTALDRDREFAELSLNERQIAEFLAGSPDYSPTTIKSEDVAAGRAGPSAQSATGGSGPGGSGPGEVGGIDQPTPGSNAWAVSGALSDSGRPMLANDPHLRFGAPGTWYLARLSLPTGEVAGATLPGSPFVIVGRNARAAWGITAAQIDAGDLLFRPEGQVTQTDPETIKVRFGGNLTVTPAHVGGDAVLPVEYFNVSPPAGQVAVLKTASDDPDNQPMALFYQLNTGRSYDQIREAASTFVSPAINLIYAERGEVFDANLSQVRDAPREDLIAYQFVGRIPRRNANGEWIGNWPSSEAPYVINPSSGIIASTNNRITPFEESVAIPGEYAVYRAIRAEERLAQTRLHNVESFAAAQLDQHSIFAERVAVALGRANPSTPEGQALAEFMRSWDGIMGEDSPEALLLTLWMHALPAHIWADELGDQGFRRFNAPRRVFIDRVINGELSPWCDDVNTNEAERCDDMLGRALDDAVVTLFDVYGEDPGAWLWGDAHQAVFPSPAFDDWPMIGGAFRRSVRFGGDPTTLNAGYYTYNDGEIRAISGPQFRGIYDLSDLDASLYIIAPGQSGHPASPHYDDLLAQWAQGDYIPIRTDWPQGVRAREAPLSEWVAESAPPGANILILRPHIND